MIKFNPAERARVAAKAQTAILKTWPGRDKPLLPEGTIHNAVVGKGDSAKAFARVRILRARRFRFGDITDDMAMCLGFRNKDQAVRAWKRERKGSSSTRPEAVLWYVQFGVVEILK